MNTQQARPRPIRLTRPAQRARTLTAARRKQAKAARYRRNSMASGIATPSGGEPEQAHLHPVGMGTNLRKTTDLAVVRDATGGVGAGSEGIRGAVGAELGAEGVADLAHGGEVAKGLAHGWEEVVVAAGGVAEVGQGGLDGVVVAGGAD